MVVRLNVVVVYGEITVAGVMVVVETVVVVCNSD